MRESLLQVCDSDVVPDFDLVKGELRITLLRAIAEVARVVCGLLDLFTNLIDRSVWFLSDAVSLPLDLETIGYEIGSGESTCTLMWTVLPIPK